MKKVMALLAVFALTLGLCACGTSAPAASQTSSKSEPQAAADSSASSETSDPMPVAGGWAIADNSAVALPDAVQKAFDTAAGEDKSLVPIAYIASQVVAGSNYMILCKSADSETGYQMIVVYADLSGSAEITQSNPFNVTDYVNSEAEPNTEQLAGGWSVPEEVTAQAIPEDAQAAFEKAMEGFVGSDVEVMALLATQVVAGMNYALLVRVTPVVQNPVSSIQVLTVYSDPSHNAEITSFCAIDPADFNK